MAVTVVLLHNDSIYHYVLEQGKSVSIGSHKKDDIFVSDFASGQIEIKWKKSSISVDAKKAYGFNKDDVPLDTMMVLDKSTKTLLYISSEISKSDKTIKLPYNCIIKFGRSRNNDVVIGLPFVSGSHFVLKNEAGKVRVEDQNSTNGIFLNGKRVTIARMKSGDILTILSIRIVLVNGELFFENVGEKLNLDNLDFSNL